MNTKFFTKITVLIAALFAVATTYGQGTRTMYVMKNGVVVFQSPVSGVDQVTFDEAAPGEALIIPAIQIQK